MTPSHTAANVRAMTLTPRGIARLAGVFQVLEGSFSLAGQQLLTGAVVNVHDATATASNILGNEALYRAALAAGLLAVVWHLLWGFLLYDLFKVIDRTVARFSLLLLVIGSALQAVTGILLFGPLVVLRSDALDAFTQQQREALSLVFLRLNAQSNAIFLAFFGCWLIAIGFLVYRSRFMPRFIGASLAIEGLGWVTYVSPPVGAALFPIITVFGVFGELFLAGWLLIKGVDNERWRAAALREQRDGDPG